MGIVIEILTLVNTWSNRVGVNDEGDSSEKDQNVKELHIYF